MGGDITPQIPFQFFFFFIFDFLYPFIYILYIKNKYVYNSYKGFYGNLQKYNFINISRDQYIRSLERII